MRRRVVEVRSSTIDVSGAYWEFPGLTLILLLDWLDKSDSVSIDDEELCGCCVE